MDLLLWVTIGFIIIGFVVLASMKKDMESKVAFIKLDMEEDGNLSKAKICSLVDMEYHCLGDSKSVSCCLVCPSLLWVTFWLQMGKNRYCTFLNEIL